jgi:integrase
MAPFLPLATLTKNKIKGYASQIFNFAVREGWIGKNPMEGMEKFRQRAKAEDGISVYTVDEVTRLLNAADPEAIPFLVLSMFCGIRRATLERLNWGDIHFNEKRVIVPAFKGKNDRRYPVTFSGNAMNGCPLMRSGKGPSFRRGDA